MTGKYKTKGKSSVVGKEPVMFWIDAFLAKCCQTTIMMTCMTISVA